MVLVTIDSSRAVQTGLMAYLSADAEIMQEATVILDEVPEPASRKYPFVCIPDLVSVPDGTHDDPGRMVTARIHTLVRGDVRGPSERLDNVIGARIMALDHQHAAFDEFVTGHTVWMLHHEEARKLPDADRSVRHRVDRVSIWTSQK